MIAQTLNRAAMTLAATLLLIFPRPVRAQESAEVVVPLTINEVPRGEVLVRVAADDIALRVADLESLGLGGEEWQRALNFSRLRGILPVLGDGEAVSLRSLAPVVSFKFDEAALTLSIFVDARFFGSSSLDLVGNRPPNIEYRRDRTGFLNYSVSSTGLRDVGVFGEVGTNFGGKLLYTSFSRAPGGSLERNLTNLTIDQRASLRRWIVGDAAIATDTLGGSALLGGVSVTRNFELDPYFIRYPSMQVRGLATTPSDVEVYVNGMLVDRRKVQPGQFELRNLPVSSGTGMTRIVVRDVYGNEQVQTNAYYYSTAVLAPGNNEYSYAAGLLRGSIFDIAGSEYGDVALVGTHRRGINDYLTLGGRAEITSAVRSGGPSVAIRTRAGDFVFAGGASDAGGRRGTAGLFGYNYLTRRYSIGVSLRAQSEEYSHLGLTPEAERPLLDASVSGSVIIFGRTSLTAQVSSLDMRDGEDTKRVGFGTSLSIGRYANVFVSAGGSRTHEKFEPEYIVGLSINAGSNLSASVSTARREGKNQVTAEVQRPLPVGTGYGFRIGSTLTDEDPAVPAVAQYQTDFGRYEVGFNAAGSDDPGISAAGGIVFGRGALMFTRAVQDSYAIVRVPGVQGVRVYASNQVIGRTNSRGDLLVPNLLSYYGNQIRINDQDVPLDYNVAATEKIIAPPYRGGAIVSFPVAQVRTVEGSIVVRFAKGDQVPAFGQLTLSRNGKQEISPLGTAGEFYMENLEAGSWDALVEWEQGSCRFALVVPAGTDPSVRLGNLTCSLEEPPK